MQHTGQNATCLHDQLVTVPVADGIAEAACFDVFRKLLPDVNGALLPAVAVEDLNAIFTESLRLRAQAKQTSSISAGSALASSLHTNYVITQ